MNDTPPEVEALVRAMMMARSGEERFVMGALMFDAAREFVIASLPRNLPPEEFKRRLFERIYGFPLEIVRNAAQDLPPTGGSVPASPASSSSSSASSSFDGS
ncbi:MAG TPA: hypothetical protein VE842_03140 [Pyrinomonadaceae bacterium]|nr:hypothetical protein [Pyrinomonadaceae bacterium]